MGPGLGAGIAMGAGVGVALMVATDNPAMLAAGLGFGIALGVGIGRRRPDAPGEDGTPEDPGPPSS